MIVFINNLKASFRRFSISDFSASHASLPLTLLVLLVLLAFHS